jgi:hypothetical protein
MNQKAKDSPLTPEPPFSDIPHQRDIQELHCHLALKTTVNSFREPHSAHAAVAYLRYQSVATQGLTCEARVFRPVHRACRQETLLAQCAVILEQSFQLLRQARILSPQRGQLNRALFAS